ncbi:hypothetical protein TL16_g05667 [Triparma laevis f. inornata]|uniref:SAM-dependent MTase RsmB/NOP-type domain-containing protein n=1 Tax=Triparma laevis f. inornata TaxID=1714386 RepID=A0A9W7AGL9_9STRA|nr:hypothetical protein TL16_g05667 [Triparma laevis f. inornata]
MLMDQSVVEHYASAGLDNANVQNYLDSATSATWRFVRLNPRFPVDEVLSQLTAEIGVEPVRVPWLPENARFFAIPGATTIKNLSTYEEGKIYGMDCSSGAAVAALGLNNNTNNVSGETRVLDLCCCPGAKLCMIVDELLGLRMEVVGVDISDSRLNISKKLLRKYIINTDANTLVKLFHADGTTFPNPKSDSLVFDSRAEAQETASSKGRKRMNKSARAREKKRLKELGGEKETGKIEKKEKKTDEPAARGSDSLFDYVLVDAECSTDGALSHLKHKNKSLKSSETGEAMLCCEERTTTARSEATITISMSSHEERSDEH